MFIGDIGHFIGHHMMVDLLENSWLMDFLYISLSLAICVSEIYWWISSSKLVLVADPNMN
jgi:hypothetical protein